MSNYPSNFLITPLCATGDKVIPPALDTDAGVGRFSQAKGFPAETSRPLTSGGMPPTREDMNGAFNILSQHTLWAQSGGKYLYNAALSYEPNCEVIHNNVQYRCIKANGPDDAKTPGSNPTYWVADLDRIYPVGAIYISTAATNPGTLFGGTWTAIAPGRVLIGANATYEAGSTGGASSHVLTTAEMPSHTHTVTVESAGGHKHTRGDMNITGQIGWHTYPDTPTGAFSLANAGEYRKGGDGGTSPGSKVNFNAANAWTGSTSYTGAHVHTASASNTGSGTSFSTMPPYLAVYMFVRTA